MGKLIQRQKIRYRIRKKVQGTAVKPRLSVFRSNAEIYAQLIDDDNSVTLASASSRDKDIAAIRNMGKEAALAAKNSKVANKALDGVKNSAKRAASNLLKTSISAEATTQSFGTDKTRGFRGWLLSLIHI